MMELFLHTGDTEFIFISFDALPPKFYPFLYANLIIYNSQYTSCLIMYLLYIL